ncbi:hypothetical protein BC830DRAFT_1231370 [Chytriomyces sp. MP71]|nr:hypothetical protein BC830DRAFT_1231370 [Chytriomyces sp. MP71]
MCIPLACSKMDDNISVQVVAFCVTLLVVAGWFTESMFNFQKKRVPFLKVEPAFGDAEREYNKRMNAHWTSERKKQEATIHLPQSPSRSRRGATGRQLTVGDPGSSTFADAGTCNEEEVEELEVSGSSGRALGRKRFHITKYMYEGYVSPAFRAVPVFLPIPAPVLAMVLMGIMGMLSLE